MEGLTYIRLDFKIIGMKRNILFFLAVPGMLIAHNLNAQEKEKEATELTAQILTARKTSNDLLRNYCWNSRTEVVKSKEILNIMIENNKYDQDGQLVQKILNEEGAKMPKSFIIRKIAENEKENMEKFLFGLRDFLKKYTLQETEQVRRFIEAASWKVIDSTHEFEFTGRNVEEEGDKLTWWVEDKNYSTARIEVFTKFQREVVFFTGTFVRLKDGLNYLAYAEAIIPSKNITLQLHNFDYIRD